MTAWFRAVLLCPLVLLFSGCSKIENPHADSQEKQGLLLFNYVIKNRGASNVTKTAVAADPMPHDTNLYKGLTLRLFIWTNYIPSTVLKNFTERCGAQVMVTCYETNDELYERLVRGEKYDVVMPAGFMLERLIHERMVSTLNPNNLPNLKNIDKEYRTNLFDPGSQHSVPYLWSTAGIAYNFAHIDFSPQKWADLLDPSPEHIHHLTNRVSLLPGSVRAIAAALLHFGYSPNSTNVNELDAAARFLNAQIQKLHFRFMGPGELINALVNEDILMAQAYSYAASNAHARNPNILFESPEDGTWITVESFAIPRTVDPEHKLLAEIFLNFLLDPVIAGKVVNFSSHASTMSEARAFVSPQIKNGPAYSYPENALRQMFDPEGLAYRETLWKQTTNLFQIKVGL